MPRHSDFANALVSFFDGCGGFGEAVEEHPGAGLVEKVQHPENVIGKYRITALDL
jgi:hypothetical protein